MIKYKALVVSKNVSSGFELAFEDRSFEARNDECIGLRPIYSCINYKDRLTVSGLNGVTRKYPIVPGMDSVSEVLHSNNKTIPVGSIALVTTSNLGLTQDGSYSEYMVATESAIIKLPERLSLVDSMMLGTAGLTAASIVKSILTKELNPIDSPIAIIGASTGVGLITTLILSQLGYEIVPYVKNEFWVQKLEAHGINNARILEKNSLNVFHNLLPETWAVVIDLIGGEILHRFVASTTSDGMIIIVGNVSANKFTISASPFFTRGITLVGLVVEKLSILERQYLWSKLSTDWFPKKLQNFTEIIKFEDLMSELKNPSRKNIGIARKVILI